MAAALLALALAGCAPDQPGAPQAAPAGPAAGSAASGATPQASAEAAARALLEAEQRLDHQASFLLLSDQGRAAYPSAADWARRRSELPPITRFELEGATSGGRVTALVEHEPGLDPFVGLSAARERLTWTARRQQGGWLLDPEPQVELLLPAPDGARDSALAWARAVQACDPGAARRQQAVDDLLGVADAPAALCRATGVLTAGPPEPVPPGPASQPLVAQYGTEVFQWARAVGVAGAGRPFHLVLAPIGDAWKVVGLFEP